MTQKKIIAVFGATGAQGGGLARAILNDPNSEFAVRVVTRAVHSDKAKALEAMGAELVEADIDKPEELKKALAGAYGAFFVLFSGRIIPRNLKISTPRILPKQQRRTG